MKYVYALQTETGYTQALEFSRAMARETKRALEKLEGVKYNIIRFVTDKKVR